MPIGKLVLALSVISVLIFASSPLKAHEPLRLNISHNTIVEVIFERIVSEALNRIGKTYIRSDLPERRAILQVDKGIDDGIGPRNPAVEKKFKNIIRVPESINTHTYVAFSKDKTIRTPGWDSFEVLNVAYINSWKIYDNNVKKAAFIMRVDSPEQLFNVLAKDRVNVALYSRLSGIVELMRLNIEGIHVLEPPLATRDVYLYLHKHHKDLAQSIAMAVKEMKADGTYEKIKKQAKDDYMSELN